MLVLPPAAAPSTDSQNTRIEKERLTELSDFPIEATFTLWMPCDNRTIPETRGTRTPQFLIKNDTVLLVSFQDITRMADVRQTMMMATRCGMPVLLMAVGEATFISSGFISAGVNATKHKRGSLTGHSVIFEPNETLMKLMGIARVNRFTKRLQLKNSLTVVRRGKIVAQWVDTNDNDIPATHDFNIVNRAIAPPLMR